MAKKAFQQLNLKPDRIALIRLINGILEEYRKQGYVLTLRQVYYQLIARDVLPESWVDPLTGTKNNYKNYKRVGKLLSDARNAGLVDWALIEDRNRETVALSHWDGPADILRTAARSLTIDLWKGQPWHVEVMVEKDALTGILQGVCTRYDVALTANKGYSSASTMYEAGQRLAWQRVHNGKKLCVIYLGDHDPSGIDMTRDVESRLRMYGEGISLKVERVALNYDQVQLWSPPENPVKDTDSRAGGYRDQFGESSWELDAVEPARMTSLVEAAILQHLDTDMFNGRIDELKRYKKTLTTLAEDFESGKLDDPKVTGTIEDLEEDPDSEESNDDWEDNPEEWEDDEPEE